MKLMALASCGIVVKGYATDSVTREEDIDQPWRDWIPL